MKEEEGLRVWSSIPSDLDEAVADYFGVVQQKASSIRLEPLVCWLRYAESNIITMQECELLEELQSKPTKAERDELMMKYQGEFFTNLVTILPKVHIIEDTQKLLLLIDDHLSQDLDRVEVFNWEVKDAWKKFEEFLHCEDEFVEHLSSRIILKLLRGHETCRTPDAEDMWSFLSWLKEGLRPDNEYLQSVAKCLQQLLQVDDYRKAFTNINGVLKIIRLLSGRARPQMQIQYQLCFCLWVTSFNEKLANKLNGYGTIPILVDILQGCPPEIIKLPRVIMATLRNFLVKPSDSDARQNNAHLMIKCKVLKHMEVLQSGMQMSEDWEYQNDFEFIQSTLSAYLTEMSKFDEYVFELRSGHVEWSIVHTSKKFWMENAERLNDDHYELLKILLGLMRRSQESTVLSISTHDVGEYMRHYPRGKKVVEMLGGKQSLVKLLEHRHPAVRYHALKSMQILMLNNYSMLENFARNSMCGNLMPEEKESGSVTPPGEEKE